MLVARVLLLIFLMCYSLLARSDTGPEYLENEADQDPLSNGFLLFRLPFEEHRQNQLHVRSFYQDRYLDGADDRQDWAGGGSLGVVGSYWNQRLALAGRAFTSQKIYADNDKADTGALQQGHDGYSVLGEAYASLTIDKLALQAGRYEINLPYINKHDIRMTPQTFQGGQAMYQLNDQVSLGGGVLSEIKSRTRDGFDAMYKKAGLDDDQNVYLGGVLYEREPGSLLGVYALHAPDYHRGAYLEASKRFWRDENTYVQLSAQYTRQESVGDELDGEFSVNHYGARVTWKHHWYSGSLAWTDYPEEDRLRSPWGGVPGYTSVMINDFDRAGETAWLLGGTLQFDTLGLPGLSLNAKAIYGDTDDCGLTASPDQSEYNLNLKYQAGRSLLNGLVLQLRFAVVDQDDTCNGSDAVDATEVRFITNYMFDF